MGRLDLVSRQVGRLGLVSRQVGRLVGEVRLGR